MRVYLLIIDAHLMQYDLIGSDVDPELLSKLDYMALIVKLPTGKACKKNISQLLN